MSDSQQDVKSPSIEQQIGDLQKAGWKKINFWMWKAPVGSGCAGYFIGPHGAWKAMMRSSVKRRATP